jgi:ACS family hexuronate transporter-like MFS transporter
LAFAALGGAGLVWIVPWLLIYREPARHPRLSRAELDYIRSEPTESAGHIPWRVLIANRPVWGLLLARFVTDPVWWFYLYWGPKFLNTRFGLKLGQIGLPVAAMYLVSTLGGIFGGWFYSYLIGHGRSNNAARKLAMLACALMVLPIMLTPRVSSLWVAAALISLAMAGHCGWAANIFTIVSDIFPKRALSSAVGICGFGGAAGGMLASTAVGFVLQATGSYLSIFALASVSYLAGLSIIHLMSPRLDAVNMEVQ